MSSQNYVYNLKCNLKKLGLSTNEITKVISAYTAIIPVLATISLRVYKERKND